MRNLERTRFRETLYQPAEGKYYFQQNWGVVTGIPYNLRRIPENIERTVDTIHPRHPHEGGNFLSTKKSCRHIPSVGKSGTDYLYTVPKTGAIKRIDSFYFGETYYDSAIIPADPPSPLEEAAKWGPTGWDRYKPAKPKVSTSVFLAELRDAPSMIFKRLRKFKDLGNNYLAWEFGWRPFLKDLRDWYSSVVALDSQIAQLRRNNGQYIKRGGQIFSKDESTDYKLIGINPATKGVSMYDKKSYLSTRVTEQCWFSARFRYYIPGLDHPRYGRAKAIRHLWDVEITPEQVWQLLPFSWLVDWFANTGSVISNIMSAVSENLTAKYAYVMLSRKMIETYKCDGTYGVITTGPLTYTYKPASFYYITVAESKARATGTPFGFNVSLPDLTGKQQLILAALGISRLNF